MQPPEGPPVWTALNFLPSGDAAADIEDDFPQGGAHGHFDQAGVVDLARQGKDLGALALLRADGGKPVGPAVDDGGRCGTRSRHC